jgi:thymidylate synthase
MFSFEANDVNEALSKGLQYLLHAGVEEDSRNGKVLVAPGPVCTVYTNPRNRVLYSATRDANPVFHFMESLWILSGSNDVEFVEYFAKNMRAYSDDGVTSWGAYGWRWCKFFGWDQLEAIAQELKKNPGSRRCVLSMWNPVPQTLDTQVCTGLPFQATAHGYVSDDFNMALHGGLDVPCNTHVYVDARGGVLNITVCNRSNDAVWGAYGANAVHMSFLQEYLAVKVGIPVGVYRQFSNNFHVYTDVFNREKLDAIIHESDTLGRLPATGPAIEEGFDEDLPIFMKWARAIIKLPAPESTLTVPSDPRPEALRLSEDVPDLKTELMQSVAVPMFLAWVYRKWKDEYSMNICLDGIDAPDWYRACREWVDRRTK